MASPSVSSASFPFAALLPKKETRADTFLQDHPLYDGRGVKVAVFDTGIDPGAVGLTTTTTGEPKILDLIDCTGSGDVKLTSFKPEAVLLNTEASVYEIEGFSGRKLKVPTAWAKTEGTWQLGIKRVYELWPKDLVSRISAERKDKFVAEHHEYEAQAQVRLSELDLLTEPSEEQLESKKDCEAQIAALKTLQDEYNDQGPLYDCVVFRPKVETELDKTSPTCLPWAVVDTTESGELSSLSPMHAFSHAHQYGVFSDASLMSYSINFYDDDILSLNVVSGTHGTHVAGIIAANYSQNPALNGVAPGAQLISMKIGDTRLGSMETNQSFMRAMNEAIKLGVDVINISYGEDSHIANNGPLMNYMRDKVIRKHKITVVSSAGNNGPGYSTVGAPGGMTSSIISVGAWVSKAMAMSQYALRDEAGDSAYTWSSRGPSIDGDRGVTIYAPGGAITCVPPYALNQSQLMNGTSMSSPNAAGGVALLICGAKAEGAAYSPGLIKRALERTAIDVKDEFKVGLLDVPAAFGDIICGDGVYEDMYFDVKVNGSKRGIIMRDAVELQQEKVYNVEIKPFFDELQTRKKFDFEVFVTLKSDESWIKHAEFVHLNHSGRTIQVTADPSQLLAGLHITSIRGYSDVTQKCLFEIPITIVKPLPPSESKHLRFDLQFSPGKIERKFLIVPEGADGCTIQTFSKNVTTPIQLWTAVTQFQSNVRRTWTSEPFVQNLTSSEEAEHPSRTVKLVPGSVEFCFAQFWSSVAEQSANVTITIDFHALTGDFGSVLSLQGGNGYKQIQVTSKTGVQELKPKVRLDMIRKHLRPSSAAIVSLGSRDLLEDSTRLYSMILQYSITFSRAGESQIILPMSGTLYENPWYSTLVQVFDEQKNLVYFCTTYPEKHKFEKKTYTVLVELVHRDRAILEKMKDQLIAIESAVEKEITLDLFESFLSVWDGPKAEFKNVKLNKGQSSSFVVSTATDLPKEASVGDLLVGSITLSKYKEIKKPVLYNVPPPAIPKKEKEEKAKTTLNLQVEMGLKIADPDEKVKFFDDLSKQHPKDLKVIAAHFDNCKEDEKEYIANSIIDLIDAKELAQHYGVSQIPTADQTDDQKSEAKEMALRRELLAKAYALKSTKSEDLANTKEFLKWTDGKSASGLLTQSKTYLARSKYGLALLRYQEAVKTGDLKSDEIKEGKEIVSKCLEALQWSAWIQKTESDKMGADPKEFRGF